MPHRPSKTNLPTSIFGDGRDELASLVDRVVGATITGIRIQPDRRRTGALLLAFQDGSVLEIYDATGPAISRRWLHTDDDLSDLVGGQLLGIELRDGPTQDPPPDSDDDITETQFLIVTTSQGRATVVTYNEHNGYYGGFGLESNLFSSWEEAEENERIERETIWND